MSAPQTLLDRLKARGTVVIEADAGGYTVDWWPPGQKGNPFCGRGASGPQLEPLIEQLAEATRPPSGDWEDARWRRESAAEYRAEQNRRHAERMADLDDRRRERRARESEDFHREREARRRSAERRRVRQVLA